jgi:mannan endo-1,4-beta-mannosidase
MIASCGRGKVARRSAWPRGAASFGGALLAMAACAPASAEHVARPAVGAVAAEGGGPIDAEATAEARALFRNLRAIAPEALLFGHEHDLAYGTKWSDVAGRSDVLETAGDYPAVYGWEVEGLFAGWPGTPEQMRRWIREGYERGGVITMEWHMGNLVSGGNAWDTTRAVVHMLPGGAQHQEYRERLDVVADFFLSLTAPETGELIPVIFRPFHEMSGSWFWWGGRNVTADEYRRLWRFTVEYLRDRKEVHNLLWAYSTDVFNSKGHYLEYYPGDEYVDVLGFDDYQSVRTPGTRDVLVRRLRDVVELAEGRGKVAALTETGVEGVPDPAWFTGTLLPAIRDDEVARRIAWVLVWRNAYAPDREPTHFYAPYRGHPAAEDLRRFREDPFVLFESELPEMYR